MDAPDLSPLYRTRCLFRTPRLPRAALDRGANAYPAIGIESIQEDRAAVLGEVFVDGAPRAGPVTVIVDKKHASLTQQGEEVPQLVCRGLVEVRVEAKN